MHFGVNTSEFLDSLATSEWGELDRIRIEYHVHILAHQWEETALAYIVIKSDTTTIVHSCFQMAGAMLQCQEVTLHILKTSPRQSW